MKFEKPDMATCFIFVGIFILWFIQSHNLNVFEPLKVLATVFLVFPLSLLGIFAVQAVRKPIKEYYQKQRDLINREIRLLRKEQESMIDVDELVAIDEEVKLKREGLRGFQSNRFEKDSIISIIWFAITLLIIYLDLGVYLNIQSRVIATIAFISGIYYLSTMIKSLFVAFEK